MKIISSQLAISMENATLYDSLEHSEKQLRKHHDELEELIEKRTAKLREEIVERKNEGYVTVSIGVSIFPDHGYSMERLIKKADAAMYMAKRSGKNKVIFS